MTEFYEKNWMINPSRSLNLLQNYLLYLFPIICYASDVKLSYVRMISLFIFTVIFCLCKKEAHGTQWQKLISLWHSSFLSRRQQQRHVAQWPRLYDRHTDGVSSLWNTETQRLRHRKSAVTESITKKTGQKNSSAEVLKRLSETSFSSQYDSVSSLHSLRPDHLDYYDEFYFPWAQCSF